MLDRDKEEERPAHSIEPKAVLKDTSSSDHETEAPSERIDDEAGSEEPVMRRQE